MTQAIKFHLDEHISSAIANGLKRRGIDVTTSLEAGLIGATDEQQLEFARQTGRVMVTQDDDFLRLHASGFSHAGIAYCRQGTRRIGQMLRALALIHDSMTSDAVVGQVLFL